MRWSIALIAALFVATACGTPAEDPPSTASPTSERYYTTAPTNAPVDETAVCVDSDQPNITEDDYVTYWQTVFDDQRAAYPDQSFPLPAQIAQDKSAEWRQGPNDEVPSGADAAFSNAVCGLPINDGQLHSGIEFRALRGQVAQYGRATCNSIAGSGVRQMWEQLHPNDRAAPSMPSDQVAQFDLLVYSALAYVCPQLADYQGLPVMKDCADLTPDPSADPEARVFCRGER
ncbi:hypothetical protein [Rhodococcus sp. 06-1460-1B]|uniref:hypothetical protein n=1 Tax=Rhodococcus sp. 06-1460-1B TaxID=2022501 RepID=UPI000B9BC155|nr:hypothetical protein [Rhodococcus sp. 06-1460-1B]OZD63159.1 hypothetical protein CH268_09500 [Rhodococcus sp. 06-1460-1B]